jgi:CTP synthase (UTP-ammonia lyase)
VPVNERSWIAVIGDRIAGFEPHDTIESSIEHASNPFSFAAPRARWLATDDLESDADGLLDGAAGVWCAPGGPFRSMEGALRGIAWARTRGVPFIGTCAGLQHAVVEFARNVLGHPAAAHAEYGRDGELFIDELLCSLVGQTMEVDVVDDELRRIYGTTRSTEKYYCRFGVNPRWQAQLHDAGLRIAGVDARDRDVRVMRLEGHPFYVLTLFVPQTSSTTTRPHPLVTGFLSAAVMARGAA